MTSKVDITMQKSLVERKKHFNWKIYSFCAIPLLLLLIFNYIPMFGVIIAFKDYKFNKGILGSKWVGFENFEVFMRSKDFLILVRNTIGLNFLFILLGLIASVALAIVIFGVTSRKATKVYQTVLITPHFLSWVVVAYMVYAILHPTQGVLNQLIEKLGGSAVDWYSTPSAWPIILSIASVWKNIGMDSVLYYAALMGTDTGLFEAADIDGANWWQKVIHITIPSLVPLMTIRTILAIGNIFRADFGLFYQLTRDSGKLYAVTDVMDTYIFRTMRELGDMGISSAAGLLQSVVGFILVMIVNAVVKKIDPDRALF